MLMAVHYQSLCWTTLTPSAKRYMHCACFPNPVSTQLASIRVRECELTTNDFGPVTQVGGFSYSRLGNSLYSQIL